MAGLRRVLNDSFFLVDGASSGASLARAYAFAIPRAGSCVDRDVDRIGEPHWPLAARKNLFRELDMGSGCNLARAGDLDLFAGRSAFQLGAIGRPAGSASEALRAGSGHVGDSLACPASGVPGPSLRDAWLEYWNRAAGLLAADRVCDRDGRSDDSNGRCRVRREIRRGIHAISSTGRSRTSKDIFKAGIGIIRFGRGLIPTPDPNALRS